MERLNADDLFRLERRRFLIMGLNWYNLPESVKDSLLLQLFILGWLSLEETFISSNRKDNLEVIVSEIFGLMFSKVGYCYHFL